MAFIEATLDADGATSKERSFPLPGPAGRTLIAGVKRTGSATFDVRLQVGMQVGAGGIEWFDVLTLDTDGEAKAVVPAISGNFRFRVETRGAGNTLRCMATL